MCQPVSMCASTRIVNVSPAWTVGRSTTAEAVTTPSDRAAAPGGLGGRGAVETETLGAEPVNTGAGETGAADAGGCAARSAAAGSAFTAALLRSPAGAAGWLLSAHPPRSIAAAKGRPTYSSTRAARADRRLWLALRQELPDNFADLLLQRRRVADMQVMNFALRIDDHQRGITADAELLRHFAIDAQRGVVQFHLVDDELRVRFDRIDVHADDDDRRLLELRGQLFHLRHRPHAPAATAIPEVENDHLPLIVLERMRLAGEVGRLEVDGRLADDFCPPAGFLGRVLRSPLMRLEAFRKLLLEQRRGHIFFRRRQNGLRFVEQLLAVLLALGRLRHLVVV